MDKLTTLAMDYQSTNNQDAVVEIQKMIFPLIGRLMHKWHFDNFPQIIKQELIEDSQQLILAKCLNSYDTSKGNCKFTSYFMTSLNFFLRSQYMKYFQKGNPISKRKGEFKKSSLDELCDLNNSFLDKQFEDTTIDIKKEVNVKFMLKAIKKLTAKDRKFLEDCYLNKKTNKEIYSKYKLRHSTLEKNKNKLVLFLKNNI